jgi:hypothetical protein
MGLVGWNSKLNVRSELKLGEIYIEEYKYLIFIKRKLSSLINSIIIYL